MRNPTTVAVSRNVRAVLALREKSQHDLAAHLGISQTAVSRRLSATLPWTIDELADVALFLDVTIIDLLPQPVGELLKRIPTQADPVAS